MRGKDPVIWFIMVTRPNLGTRTDRDQTSVLRIALSPRNHWVRPANTIMVPVEGLLNDILRPSDEVKVVLEAALAQPSSGTNLHAPGVHDPRHNVQNRCVLAVISHKDDWDLTEEGRWVMISLSYFRQKASRLMCRDRVETVRD